MVRSEYAPLSAALQTKVVCFWTLEASAEAYHGRNGRRQIAPDSYVDVIFQLGAPLYLVDDTGGRIRLPSVFVKHLQMKPLELYSDGDCQLFGIRLYPWGLSSLIAGRLQAFHTGISSLDEQWQQLANTVARLWHQGKLLDVINLLEGVLIKQLYSTGEVRNDTGLIHAVGQDFYQLGAATSIERMAATYHYSQSQLERRFQQSIGLTPKTFSRLVRFERVRDQLTMKPEHPLTALAYDYGFSDQSHLIRDFRQFARMTPGAFAAEIKSAWRV
jgi:AraC-like DNA-binding protein